MSLLSPTLHTVTVVAHNARTLIKYHLYRGTDAVQLADRVLSELGHAGVIETRDNDDTVRRCVEACMRVIARGEQ